MRATLAAQTRTIGPDYEGTIGAESQLAGALNNLGEYAEAEALGRGMAEKHRRILGRDHRSTLVVSGKLAVSLPRQGRCAEEIEREVLVRKTRPVGTEHEETLVSATNLADSLSRCGLKMETE